MIIMRLECSFLHWFGAACQFLLYIIESVECHNNYTWYFVQHMQTSFVKHQQLLFLRLLYFVTSSENRRDLREIDGVC